MSRFSWFAVPLLLSLTACALPGAPGAAPLVEEKCSSNTIILIGPEGGFAPEERTRLRAAPFVTPVTLGPRILRADTAAIAALTLWQAAIGDWER